MATLGAQRRYYNHAAKDAEAIKDCIRRNEHVAITLYRDLPPDFPRSTTTPDISPYA
jgi:hypothetical protein